MIDRFGVTSVRCPVCRAAEGRPCRNRRGYLVRTHAMREASWREQLVERA